ncbi:putative phosphatidate phosphatase isoform X2 [Macrobrachium rosenbergii]|uniref:putative phosphatidate phosphatase isoform X2 n=1 Tax=Macrobrachium rosenbergii TaxID=79674 RepID=UPI0034D6F346
MERKYMIKGTLNFILLLIVAIPILVLFLVGKPYERGFNCDDQSLRYPYKDSTVHTLVLYFVGTGLPAIAISLLEWSRTRRESVGKPVKLCGRNLHSWFWAAYCSVGTFLFGCACSQLTTDIAKYTVGRLRPHFVDICKPDWSQINCSEIYVQHIPCTNTDEHRLKEARLSFPSGHASFSAYTMIYLVIYLQVRFKFKGPELLRPFLQFVCLMLTFYTSVSRISDYKHHWSDVLSGFIIGTIVAILIALYFSDLFPRELPTTTKKNETVFLRDYARAENEVHTARTDGGE